MTIDPASGVRGNYGQGIKPRKSSKADQSPKAPEDSLELTGKKIKVLEVDQWTSTGNVQNFTMEDFNLGKVKGGDSEAAKQIFGGHAAIREVSPQDAPHIGEVWYISDPQSNKLKFYKANYDSSD